MRRRVPTVNVRRLSSLAGEADALGRALPGLLCGVLGLAVVLYGTCVPSRVSAAAPHVAPVGSGSVAATGSGGRS